MENTFVKILTKIVDGISKEHSFEEVDAALKRERIYIESAVSAAYSWFFDKLLANKLQALSDPKSIRNGVRILSEDEISLIGVENYNRLLKLVQVGFLNGEDIEMFIENVRFFPIENLQSEDITLILLASLFDIDKSMLPGSRTILYLSDTIH
ncbi:hypothetical protein BAC3_01885 [uncultured bacterium]|nr:hypothetical protein BAC3_01885 [uncultured bacterium]